MFDLSLSLFPRKCKHVGCSNTAGLFGACRTHEAEAVRRAFWWFAGKGVPHTPPKCFKSLSQWHEYVVAYFLSRNPKLQREVHEVNYCKDCNPKFKQQMMAVGSCAHPETVFVRDEGGDVIGVPLKDMRKPHTWEKAVMGMSGQVVQMPPAEVIDKIVNELAIKRKGGRPRKDRGDAVAVPDQH